MTRLQGPRHSYEMQRVRGVPDVGEIEKEFVPDDSSREGYPVRISVAVLLRFTMRLTTIFSSRPKLAMTCKHNDSTPTFI